MDDDSKLTNWGCYHCRYHAKENELDESNCESCGNKTKIKLKDSETEYGWVAVVIKLL